jgi:hypothetical protein
VESRWRIKEVEVNASRVSGSAVPEESVDIPAALKTAWAWGAGISVMLVGAPPPRYCGMVGKRSPVKIER